MRTLIFPLIFLAKISLIYAQEVCDAEGETLQDLNSITKCTIDNTEKENSNGKKVKQLSVKISSSFRYLKKRIKNKEAVSSLSDLNTSGIKDLNASTNSAVNNGANNPTSILMKQKDVISKMEAKYSADQLRKALEFDELDQIPLFDSCDSNLNKRKSLACFNTEMMAHIQEHFRYPNTAILNKIEGNVWVRFVIDENGQITNLKALGPRNGESLKEEAIRVVSKLQSFKPAVKKGNNVLVKYGFPINFSLED